MKVIILIQQEKRTCVKNFYSSSREMSILNSLYQFSSFSVSAGPYEFCLTNDFTLYFLPFMNFVSLFFGGGAADQSCKELVTHSFLIV